MTKPMTPKQRRALAFIAEQHNGNITGWRLQTAGLGNTGTLNQLQSRGYMQAFGSGHISFPPDGIWKITEKGKRAVKMGDAA